jgi:hypothetical protein
MCAIIVTFFTGAWAFTLNETISVDGHGEMSASTDISNTGENSNARDNIRGFGSHWYHRMVNSNDTFSQLNSDYDFNSSSPEKGRGPKNLLARRGLNSKYNLTADLKPNYNIYSISTKSDAGKLAHSASASWLDSFSSRSSVINSETKLSTNFDVNGNGDFSESILNRGERHVRLVASSSISGNFHVKSELAEKITLNKDDIQRLRSKLDEMNANISIDEGKTKDRRNQIGRARTANLVPPEKETKVYESLSTIGNTTGLNCTTVGTGTNDDPYRKVCINGDSSSLNPFNVNGGMDCMFVGNGTTSDPYKRICERTAR